MTRSTILCVAVLVAASLVPGDAVVARGFGGGGFSGGYRSFGGVPPSGSAESNLCRICILSCKSLYFSEKTGVLPHVCKDNFPAFSCIFKTICFHLYSPFFLV